jgi:hypothetical protein
VTTPPADPEKTVLEAPQARTMIGTIVAVASRIASVICLA